MYSINSHIPSDKTVYHHVIPILRSVKFLYIKSDDGPKDQNIWLTLKYTVVSDGVLQFFYELNKQYNV
jgi:hypothetical protein